MEFGAGMIVEGSVVDVGGGLDEGDEGGVGDEDVAESGESAVESMIGGGELLELFIEELAEEVKEGRGEPVTKGGVGEGVDSVVSGDVAVEERLESAISSNSEAKDERPVENNDVELAFSLPEVQCASTLAQLLIEKDSS